MYRELENFVRRIIVVAEGDRITRADLAIHFPAEPEQHFREDAHETDMVHREDATTGHPQTPETLFEGHTWEEVERAYVHFLLERNEWHITGAAKAAGVNRSTFDSRIKKLGIRK